MLSVVLGWGKPRGFVTENAAAGVDKIQAPRDARKQNRAYADGECRAVLGEATGGLKVAIGLGMFAGMRGGDVVRAGRSTYDGQVIEWRQGKTGDLVWLPVHRELRVILDQAPRVATTIVTGAHGRPWTEATLRKEFHALVVRLERAGRVGPGLTFHGPRSTAGKVLADLGADVRAIQALLGHRTAAMALHYSNEADRRRAATAAVHALERKSRR
jgi:integrase